MGCLAASLFLVFVFMTAFVAYDRCTGTTSLEMAQVIKTWHEQYTTTHTTYTTRHGKTFAHTSTTEHNYYWVYFQHKNGVTDRTNVGSRHFGTYSGGQQIVVNYTVGGYTKTKYLVNIRPFVGAEKPL
jgi:hypothetical protein